MLKRKYTAQVKCIELTSSTGLQLRTEELMNTIPLRETVAGDALSILCGSKATLQFGAMGMRSPLASVRVLLSSKTEFKFSIQMASTGPSKTIQMLSPRRIQFMQINSYMHTHYSIHTFLEGEVPYRHSYHYRKQTRI